MEKILQIAAESSLFAAENNEDSLKIAMLV